MLIAHGIHIDQRDELGDTPFFWAVFFGNESLVDLFLEQKADANVPVNGCDARNPGLPLKFAIRNGFTSIALKLITHGADLNSPLWGGTASLNLAAEMGDVGVIKALLARGVKINAGHGETLLGLAVCGNSPEAVRLLIANGANLQTNILSGNNNSSLFHLWAKNGVNTNIADEMLLAGYDLKCDQSQRADSLACGR